MVYSSLKSFGIFLLISFAVCFPSSVKGSGIFIAGTASDFETRKTKEWIQESYDILDSNEFHHNLQILKSHYAAIWLSPYLDLQSPKQLSKILKLNSIQHPEAWRVPAALSLSGFPLKDENEEDGYGKEGDRYAGVGWTGYSENGISTASMRIGRVHFDRYANGSVVERSCAINTLVHEISHTYSRFDKQYVEFILDTNKSKVITSNGPDGTPVASYYIGSVAQCTFLQKRKRILSTDLRACVQTFGLTRCNSDRCNDFNEANSVITPKL